MLVSELKKVIDIDSHITRLHNELAELYSQRQQYIQYAGAASAAGDTADSSLASSSEDQNSDDTELQNRYDELSRAWAIYDIKIPDFGSMRKSLIMAETTLNKLSANQPEMAGKVGLLLVPPTHILGQPLNNSWRQYQPFISLDDYLDSQLNKRYQQKKWTLLAVYLDAQPLDYGKAKDLIKNKRYLINGIDTRGLGIYEYFALSLQSAVPLDRYTWTMLLKGCSTKSKIIPSVTFINGQYRFEADECDGVFGDERFRPAVKVAVI